jgi:hypothetical protein
MQFAASHRDRLKANYALLGAMKTMEQALLPTNLSNHKVNPVNYWSRLPLSQPSRAPELWRLSNTGSIVPEHNPFKPSIGLNV